MKNNIASECIRTVAVTYGCKILRLYKYEAHEYGYEERMITQEYHQFMQHKRQLYSRFSRPLHANQP